MNKIFAVILAALLFVWAPVGAQNSDDIVFQTMTSEQEWPAVYADWRAVKAANDDVASVNVIGATAHRIAVSRQHPAASMEVQDYIRAFFEANPALMPENGTVKLETFLTLARAGKIQHPPVSATAAHEVAPAPAVAAPVVTTEEAARRANIAIRRSTEAVDGMAKLSAEVERLASRSVATDPAVLRRLAALEKGLKEVPTKASLEALAGTVTGLQQTVINQTSGLTNVEMKVKGQGETITSMTAELKKVQGEVDTLIDAPPKADSFARLMTVGAIVLALLALIIGFIARSGAKESRRVADLANRSVSAVMSVQEIHQEDIKRLHRRTADMKDIFIHEALIKHLEKLSGNRKHRSVVRVDDEEYVLVFQLSADDKGMYRVFGIEGQHNAVSKKNMRSVILRAARDGRLNQKAEPASGFEEDEEDDKVTPISAAVAVK